MHIHHSKLLQYIFVLLCNFSDDSILLSRGRTKMEASISLCADRKQQFGRVDFAPKHFFIGLDSHQVLKGVFILGLHMLQIGVSRW